ncbi:MAG: glycosyltransferase family 2 protein [Chloroflexota bacterium]
MSIEHPLISIVTPSYNQGQFIRETIESVLGQSYDRLEYFVMDGGSTDDTVSILKEYESDPRFHWVSEKDNGQSDAINKAWRQSQGDVVAWLNSDDTYCEDALQRVADAFAHHPDAIGVYGECMYTDAEGVPWRETFQGEVTRQAVLNLSCYIDQPTVFVKLDRAKAAGMVDESFHHQMDYELWLRVGFPNDFVYIPAFLATWRAHEETKSVSNPRRGGDELLRIIQKAEEGFYPLEPDEIDMLNNGAKRRAIEYLLADSISRETMSLARNHLQKHPEHLKSLSYRAVKTLGRDTMRNVGVSQERLRKWVEIGRRMKIIR